ncbi:hypothetical protein [Rubrolithibacter danxiaensis]|uniref:hypothetical protein n=1 Tax=Rubrolithibacter danxiaensis TaxID=3390805 RepID=UPI003BF802C5
MPAKKSNADDFTEVIELFLEELPDPKTSMQSTFSKEFSTEDNKRIILLAQQAKSAKGMKWNVNIRKYLN